MTNNEIILALKANALAIMSEPKATPETASGRADDLEVAHRCLVCCAILSGEISFNDLNSLLSWKLMWG